METPVCEAIGVFCLLGENENVRTFKYQGIIKIMERIAWLTRQLVNLSTLSTLSTHQLFNQY
jgi:hypothetical protein